MSTAALTAAEDWELDFYSRPILEADGRKRWELLITSTPAATGDAEGTKGLELLPGSLFVHRATPPIRPWEILECYNRQIAGWLAAHGEQRCSVDSSSCRRGGCAPGYRERRMV